MEILQAVKKIPGGLMVVPLLLRTIVNTFFGDALWSIFDGTFTAYLWELGAMPVPTVFIFCNTTAVNFKKVGVMVYRDMLITAVKVGMGTIIGLIYGTLFGEEGFLGLSTLAIIDALTNSSGRLYAALTGEHGDATDVGAVSTLSISDDPFFTMVALGAAGVAKIPMSILIGCIVPVTVGCILDNLDKDIRKFCESDATTLIPFFVFPLGAGLSIVDLLKAEGPGILLGVACTLTTDLAGYLVYKLLRMSYPEMGGAIGTIAGNTAVTPAPVAAADATLLAVAEVTTAQITAAITVTATLCPVLISYLHKIEMRRHGR